MAGILRPIRVALERLLAYFGLWPEDAIGLWPAKPQSLIEQRACVRWVALPPEDEDEHSRVTAEAA